jgi:UDPglucose--hexose-1-phosphate uridylyltransferase
MKRGVRTAPAAGAVDLRVDPLTGDRTFVVSERQDRPNLPSQGCPFCPGGLESPEPYTVRWFVNRWPPMPDDRCEVVLYSPDHDATFWSLGPEGALQVVDLWAERSAVLGARDDVAHVLVFENRGSEVGATIPHPHGQIYAFDHVPPLPARELERGAAMDDPADGLIGTAGSWVAWVPSAASYPYQVRVASTTNSGRPPPDLPSLDPGRRRDLARLLVDVLRGFDRLFDAEMPYMLWIHQRPFDGGDWPQAQVHLDIVSPWRTRNVVRYVAAGELGSGEYFNPVASEDAAARLRAAMKRG